MKKMLLILGMLLLTALKVSAQKDNLTQTVRGQIIDEETSLPLPYAAVVILEVDPPMGTTTDADGKFSIPDVPVGRITLAAEYLGYEPVVLPNIILSSGKQLVLDIKMKELVTQVEEVVVDGSKEKGAVLNDMVTISARKVTIEDIQKFAGALGDPSRMVQAYAGVQTTGTGNNDIIVRGNSPQALLWRMEGINIPNPNHFSTSGANGGPISILNNNNLANSDFYTGAFAAEYGNVNAAVFDLQLRKGNDEKFENLFQVGFNGVEVGTEGPLSKKKGGSYVVNYRYSTLGFFDAVGIDIGVAAIPYYHDLTMRMDFPSNRKTGQFTLWGVGGWSNIDFLDEDLDKEDREFLDERQDARYSFDMGVVGLSHKYILNDKSYLNTTLAFSGTNFIGREDSIIGEDREGRLLGFKSQNREMKYSVHTLVNNKFNRKNSLKSGIIADITDFMYLDSLYDEDIMGYRTERDADGFSSLIQGYTQWQHRFSDELTLNTGLHTQWLTLNNSFALEPRIGVRWQFRERQTISAAAGMHSQQQPYFYYFYQTYVPETDEYLATNEQLDFTRSAQFVLGYELDITPTFKLKAEAYYQHIYDIPVEQRPSYFAMSNLGATFDFTEKDSLVNGGRGRNYGLDITLEKFFNNNYYFLVTGSIFDAKYKGSDDVWRNSAFNANYSVTVLGGYELQLSKRSALTIDLSVSATGGNRYIPIDFEASEAAGVEVLIFDEAYEPRFKDFFRSDLKVGYRWNMKRATQTFQVDIQNVTNTQNVFFERYDPNQNKIVRNYQTGLLPVVLYKIEF